MEYLFTIVAAILALVVVWKFKTRNLPPGPWGFPIVGYIPFLTKNPHLKLQRLIKKYGNVFSIRLGSHYVVVVNDFHNTKEAFSKDIFIARPPEFAFELTETSKKTGAILGPPWREQRRLALHLLRDMGLGKSKMEGHMQEEIEELLKHFELKNGQPFCPRELLGSSTSNNVSSLVFGKRFAYDDPFRLLMNNMVNETVEATGQTAWTLFFPWLKKIVEVLGILDIGKVSRLTQQAKALYRKEIEEHERTLDPENIRDFIDGYLLEIKKRNGEPPFHKDVLTDIVGAFFGAGSETVRTAVEWLVLLAAYHQDHQRRLQAEIDEVVGRNRLPNGPDQKDMPYTNAYIMEMQRWRTLLPLNLLRSPLVDTELDGYFIPKNTIVLSNLWSVHHNPDYWGADVDEFKPERFLSDDGKSIKKIDHWIPFSIGKRSCPGEPLARVETFLYFAAILQRFDVRAPDGQPINLEPSLGLSLRPALQDVVMTKRN